MKVIKLLSFTSMSLILEATAISIFEHFYIYKVVWTPADIIKLLQLYIYKF